MATENKKSSSNVTAEKNELEVGLQEVANEMGRILKELKENLKKLAAETTKSNDKMVDSGSFDRNVSGLKKKLDSQPKLLYANQRITNLKCPEEIPKNQHIYELEKVISSNFERINIIRNSLNSESSEYKKNDQKIMKQKSESGKSMPSEKTNLQKTINNLPKSILIDTTKNDCTDESYNKIEVKNNTKQQKLPNDSTQKLSTTPTSEKSKTSTISNESKTQNITPSTELSKTNTVHQNDNSKKPSTPSSIENSKLSLISSENKSQKITFPKSNPIQQNNSNKPNTPLANENLKLFANKLQKPVSEKEFSKSVFNVFHQVGDFKNPSTHSTTQKLKNSLISAENKSQNPKPPTELLKSNINQQNSNCKKSNPPFTNEKLKTSLISAENKSQKIISGTEHPTSNMLQQNSNMKKPVVFFTTGNPKPSLIPTKTPEFTSNVIQQKQKPITPFTTEKLKTYLLSTESKSQKVIEKTASPKFNIVQQNSDIKKSSTTEKSKTNLLPTESKSQKSITRTESSKSNTIEQTFNSKKPTTPSTTEKSKTSLFSTITSMDSPKSNTIQKNYSSKKPTTPSTTEKSKTNLLTTESRSYKSTPHTESPKSSIDQPNSNSKKPTTPEKFKTNLLPNENNTQKSIIRPEAITPSESPKAIIHPEFPKAITRPQSPKAIMRPESPKAITQSPKAITSLESPKPTTRPESPKAITPSESPKATNRPESPKTITRPESHKSITRPESPKAITRPESRKSITRPESLKAITRPESPKTITRPEARKSITRPESLKAITRPESPKTITRSESPKAIIRPEAPKVTTRPESPKAITRPESRKSITRPESLKAITRPESPKTITRPESPKATIRPEAPKATTRPESPKAITRPESPKATTRPESPKTITCPKSPKSSIVKQNSNPKKPSTPSTTEKFKTNLLATDNKTNKSITHTPSPKSGIIKQNGNSKKPTTPSTTKKSKSNLLSIDSKSQKSTTLTESSKSSIVQQNNKSKKPITLLTTEKFKTLFATKNKLQKLVTRTVSQKSNIAQKNYNSKKPIKPSTTEKSRLSLLSNESKSQTSTTRTESLKSSIINQKNSKKSSTSVSSRKSKISLASTENKSKKCIPRTESPKPNNIQQNCNSKKTFTKEKSKLSLISSINNSKKSTPGTEHLNGNTGDKNNNSNKPRTPSSTEKPKTNLISDQNKIQKPTLSTELPKSTTEKSKTNLSSVANKSQKSTNNIQPPKSTSKTNPQISNSKNSGTIAESKISNENKSTKPILITILPKSNTSKNSNTSSTTETSSIPRTGFSENINNQNVNSIKPNTPSTNDKIKMNLISKENKTQKSTLPAKPNTIQQYDNSRKPNTSSKKEKSKMSLSTESPKRNQNYNIYQDGKMVGKQLQKSASVNKSITNSISEFERAEERPISSFKTELIEIKSGLSLDSSKSNVNTIVSGQISKLSTKSLTMSGSINPIEKKSTKSIINTETFQSKNGTYSKTERKPQTTPILKNDSKIDNNWNMCEKKSQKSISFVDSTSFTKPFLRPSKSNMSCVIKVLPVLNENKTKINCCTVEQLRKIPEKKQNSKQKSKILKNENNAGEHKNNMKKSVSIMDPIIDMQVKKPAMNSALTSKIKIEKAISIKLLQNIVECAKKENKTFTVCGGYSSVRKALVSRGWVEKLRLSYFGNSSSDRELRKLNNFSIQELLHGTEDKMIGHSCKRVIMSKLLANHQVDFYWDYSNDIFKIVKENVKPTIINRFRRGLFNYTSKQGLCELVKRAHWFQKPGTSNMRHPRSYSLTNNGDPKEFVDDFKMTAATSLLQWVVETASSKQAKLLSDAGKIPITAFHFAIDECTKYIKKARHEDIDYEIEEALDFEWNTFLGYYYKTVHICNHFKSDGKETEKTITQKAQFILDKIMEYNPNIEVDGVMNIWILKPINGSRGIGIHICRTLQYILQVIKSHASVRYIVQKYIEKPLLIYNTKFDIRQWFLISDAVPLTVWIYKECYLRFSSQTYNLRKLHESVHLTNNSVQCKYRNCFRDVALPTYNMWDLRQFESYLSDIGYPNVYQKIIYPGMKECITSAILLNQDNIEPRKHCFELYGADFMLTEDFQPWLIEINSRPALYASTPVTSRMCPQVLEDVIKVVIDNARNYHSSTGRFELLYRQVVPKLPPLDESSLQLSGRPLPSNYFCNSEEKPKPKKISVKKVVKTKLSEVDIVQQHMKDVSNDMKKTLENLLKIIQKEKLLRKQQKLAVKESKSIQAIEEKVATPPIELRTVETETIIPPQETRWSEVSSDFTDSSYSDTSLSELEKDVKGIEESFKDSDANSDAIIGEQESLMLEEAISNLRNVRNKRIFKNISNLLQVIKQHINKKTNAESEEKSTVNL